LPTKKSSRKILFFSLANEGNGSSQIGDDFQQLQQTLSANTPKDFVAQSARYPDEDHGSTVLVAHYAGLRAIFANWQMLSDLATGLPTGGVAGIEQHYRELSERYGYIVSSESTINQLGYALLARSRASEAVTVFKRNIELYPHSANVYDSLADGLEATGEPGLAMQNVEKAVAVATETNDRLLPDFKKHLERLSAAGKNAAGKSSEAK
jgi:tetratricopeptide (TPR) repeat protein